MLFHGFLKLKCPLWVPVRAQQNVHGIVWAAAAIDQNRWNRWGAIDHSLISATAGWRCEPIVVRMRPLCNHTQPPPGRSHAHFAEREQEPIAGISTFLVRHDIPRWPYGIRIAMIRTNCLDVFFWEIKKISWNEQDIMTITKLLSITSVRIIDCTLIFPKTSYKLDDRQEAMACCLMMAMACCLMIHNSQSQ